MTPFKLVVAFATDDKINFTKEHFGKSKEYLIYEISKTEAKLKEVVENCSPEEEMQGGLNKSNSVAQLLKSYKVQVLVNKAFGKNIVRMKRQFVCVLSNSDSIEETINNIQLQFEKIVSELDKGEERNYLRI